MEQTTQQINGFTTIATPPLSYCLYARKSSESDEKQTMSIDSQIKEMTQIAQRENMDIVEIKQESHSAKDSGQRPVFNQMIDDIRKGKFNAILTWAPDRLSRNAGDLGSIVDLLDQQKLCEIKTYGQKFTNSPNEKFLLMILGSQAKLENDNKSINVKRGLRTKVEMGLWPSTAPTGYLNEKRTDRKGYVLVDTERALVIKQMFEKVANNSWSGRQIYRWLKDELNFTTKTGKNLSLSNIYLILRSTFYHGTFEYPAKSGNFYTGQHQPIISKELYDKVQKQIRKEKVENRTPKEFAFTRLMKCGCCGSGITADEKFKTLKDGTVNRYIYYICTKRKDIDCKNGYLREVNLIEQLIEIIDKIDLNRLGIKEQAKQEIDRFHNFQTTVLGVKEQKSQPSKSVNIRNYAKYLLKKGTLQEKRDLLANLKSKLIIENKQVRLEK